MKKLLICIAHHYNTTRIDYLLEVIKNCLSYKFETQIVIDCNTNKIQENIPKYDNVCVNIHDNLVDPFQLTSVHRKYVHERIDDFDYFMYLEDDMLLPEDNLVEYFNNFDDLYKLGCVPSFIRLEEHNKEFFIVDVTTHQQHGPILKINGKAFANLSHPYHAFWIMPQNELKQSISENPNLFNSLSSHREVMASLVMWQLNKSPYVLLEENKVSHLSYSFHLPNNYSKDPNTAFGKIRVNDLTFNGVE